MLQGRRCALHPPLHGRFPPVGGNRADATCNAWGCGRCIETAFNATRGAGLLIAGHILAAKVSHGDEVKTAGVGLPDAEMPEKSSETPGSALRSLDTAGDERTRG